MTFWRGFTVLTICGLLHSGAALAVFTNYLVNSNADTNTGSVISNVPTGTLRYVLTQMNSGGTSGAATTNNTIAINPNLTIVLTNDLPVITKGVNIAASSGTLTIDGSSNFRIFATYQASLAVGSAASTTTLTNGAAIGGAGGTGNLYSAAGGGGLGAGGAAYVDLGQQLSLINTTISGCAAIGGAGGSASTNSGLIGGGGGGASWSSSKAGGTPNGGGDFPGLSSPSSAGGGVSEGVTGYGGGAGGASFSGGTPGGAGGSGAGSDTSNGNGGAGGYCGGGGGADSSGGGGGGGNGGGKNTLSAPIGGGGGGYGSGGAGGQGTNGSAAGGGGGLGGGGGGGTGGFPNGGGGGGGFGAGGGGGASFNYAYGGSGGLYGGHGASGNSNGSTLGGGGGGGGALGGAVFVGDGATFNVGDSITIAPGSNSVTGGAAGPGGVIPATAGTGYATDIFLFKSATLNFNGAANQTFNTAIQSDQNNPVSPAPPIILDNGVTVNLTAPASNITLGSTNNNWRGGTVITAGGIIAGVTNLPAAGNISIASQGTLNITDGSSANTITNAGTLSFTGAASTTAPITNSGTMSTSATFTNSSTITNSGAMSTSAAFTNNGTVTNSGTLNISTAFTNNSIVNNTSTGIINLSSTFTGSGSFTHSGILNINSVPFTPPTTFNNTGMTNLNGTANIVGNFTGSTGSGLTVGNTSSSNYSTSGNITGLTTLNVNPLGTANGTIFTINNAVTGGSNSTFNIGANSTVNLTNGTAVSNFNSIIVNGTYNIASGATYTLNADNNLSGNGTISNQGQFFLNGNVSFGGSFSNLSSGTTTINGTPTITFSGNTFTNTGNLITNFSSSNSLPTINVANVTVRANLNLSHGIIAVGYNNNFIASGNYTLLNAGTPPVPGVAILPQNTFYISDWQLTTVGNSLVVKVTRNGFGNHALTPEAQQIGNFLEQLGASGPNTSQLQLLNALEGIQNDAQLTAALLSLMPPQYTMLVTLELLDQLTGALDIRLASLNHGYNSGDEPGSDRVSVWLRPFSSTGTQQPKNTLSGYTDKNRGWLLGMDRTINDKLTLGAAASYSKTTVTDTLQPNSITNINTYQFTFYSTLKSPKDIYVDSLIAGGVSNYHGLRTIVFPGYVLGASSNYSSQQLTLKLRASKIFNLADFWQFTPNAMAQYSFVRQLAYSESGAGSYDVYTDPDNINLFRLGVGAILGIPFTTNNMLSIPNLYAGMYVDATGGADTTNSQFVSGGPIITNSVQSGRFMIKYGASYELKFNDHLEFVANYDYIWRNSGFKGTEGLLNFRYTF